MSDLNIVVTGASGRMGRTLIREIAQGSGITLCGALEMEGHPNLGLDSGTLAGTSFFATVTMAGRNSRSPIMKPVCITSTIAPGGLPAAGTSAMAWCRLGSNLPSLVSTAFTP